MNKMNLKIQILKLMIFSVVTIGLIAIYVIGKPLAITVYNDLTRDTHLCGEVLTAKDLSVTVKPVRLFYDKWDVSSGYDGNFVNDGYTFKHGIGWYVPSKTLKMNETGTTQLGFWLGGEFDEIYFHLCTDSEWNGFSDAGEYRIICYVNGEMVKDTGFNDYTYSEKIKLNVSGANDIVIELQEIKGSSGTQNVILGEFEASKSQKGKEF